MESPAGLTIQDYIWMLRRHWRLIAWLAMPVVILSSVLALALPDVYRSTAFFQLRQEQVPEGGRYARGDYADRYIHALSEKVVAGENLQRIVRRIQPYPELQANSQEATRLLAENVDVSMTTETILDPLTGRQRDINSGFLLSYDNPNPVMAFEVAKWLAQDFLVEGRASKAEQASNSSAFLEGQVERAQREIAQREAELAEFKSKNFGRLPELAQANVNSVERIESDLRAMHQELAALRQSRTFVVQRLQDVAQEAPQAGNLRALEDEYNRKAATYSESHPDLVALRRQIESLRRGGISASAQSLQQQLVAERAVLAEARQRYSDDHPDIKRLARNIESLELRIAAGATVSTGYVAEMRPGELQLETQVRSLDSQIQSLEAASADLRRRRSEYELRLASTPEVEREYQRVVRGLEGARNQYDDLLRQKLESDIAAAGALQGRADLFELVGAPSMPTGPDRPMRLGILALGVMLATAFALGGALIAELRNATVRGSQDVLATMNVTPLSVIPEISTSVNVLQHRRQVVMLVAFGVICIPAAYLAVRIFLT